MRFSRVATTFNSKRRRRRRGRSRRKRKSRSRRSSGFVANISSNFQRAVSAPRDTRVAGSRVCSTRKRKGQRDTYRERESEREGEQLLKQLQLAHNAQRKEEGGNPMRSPFSCTWYRHKEVPISAHSVCMCACVCMCVCECYSMSMIIN